MRLALRSFLLGLLLCCSSSLMTSTTRLLVSLMTLACFSSFFSFRSASSSTFCTLSIAIVLLFIERSVIPSRNSVVISSLSIPTTWQSVFKGEIVSLNNPSGRDTLWAIESWNDDKSKNMPLSVHTFIFLSSHSAFFSNRREFALSIHLATGDSGMRENIPGYNTEAAQQ